MGAGLGTGMDGVGRVVLRQQLMGLAGLRLRSLRWSRYFIGDERLSGCSLFLLFVVEGMVGVVPSDSIANCDRMVHPFFVLLLKKSRALLRKARGARTLFVGPSTSLRFAQDDNPLKTKIGGRRPAFRWRRSPLYNLCCRLWRTQPTLRSLAW